MTRRSWPDWHEGFRRRSHEACLVPRMTRLTSIVACSRIRASNRLGNEFAIASEVPELSGVAVESRDDVRFAHVCRILGKRREPPGNSLMVD